VGILSLGFYSNQFPWGGHCAHTLFNNIVLLCYQNRLLISQLERMERRSEDMSIIWVIATAVLSSAMTLAVVALWGRFYFQPRLRDNMQKELDEQVEKAAEVLSSRVEEGVRRGLVDGVRNLDTREVLEGASRSLARSSAELVGERLGQIFGAPKKNR
jgi:cell division protein FtsL